MPRRGENIYKRKDNRWEGRYVRSYDTNGKAKFGYVYAKTYREVREKLHKVQLSGESPKGTTKKTISNYCDEWLVLSRNRVKESTYAKYYAIVSKHLKPALGHFMPEKMDSLIIEDFSNKLLVIQKLSPKTVQDILTLLHSILKYVCKQEEKCKNIEIIYPKDNKQEMRILTLEEQEIFISYLATDMDEVKFGILLALFSGMRIGEICALQWKDIDLENKTIMVSKTMQRISDMREDAVKKTKVVIRTAKSEHSVRIIPIINYGEELCKQMRSNNPEAYILTGNESHFMEPRALQYRLKKYTLACNLDGIHFHSLRHTFATRCVEVDFELKSLSKILGHASAKITLDRYVHSSLELKRANMEKLKKVGF